MRIDLNDDNTTKANEASHQLLEKHGVSISPNQIVNIVFGAIEQLELQQTVTVTFKSAQSAGSLQVPQKKKIIRKTTNWVTRL